MSTAFGNYRSTTTRTLRGSCVAFLAFVATQVSAYVAHLWYDTVVADCVLAVSVLAGVALAILMRVQLRRFATTERALAESEVRYRFVAEHATDMVTVHEADGTCLYASPSSRVVLGYEPSELVGRGDLFFVEPVDRARCAALVRRAQRTATPTRLTFRARNREGDLLWLETSVHPVAEEGTAGRLHLTSRDVTQRENALRELAERQRFSDKMEQTIPHIVYIYDLDANSHAYVNQAIEDALGYSPDAVKNMGARLVSDLVHADDRMTAGLHFQRVMAARDGEVHDVEYRVRHFDGDYRWLRTREVVFERSVRGVPNRILGIAEDVTERKTMEARLAEHMAQLTRVQGELEVRTRELEIANTKLERLATRDPLTGVANRRAFDRRLDEELARAAEGRTVTSLLAIDVDLFKQFNDAFGHPAGDEVLRRLGRLLVETVREEDFVARVGGEEFSVILPSTDRARARATAERIREAVEKSPWPGRNVTCSVGVASLPDGGHDRAGLVEGADRSLYAAKRAGRNRVVEDEPDVARAA
ncbi:MAG: diguanylate cyclase [Fimbriimonadaceae bacterium]|nr:diguanylate cyclase [Fimbriimonadaceae bacterium]